MSQKLQEHGTGRWAKKHGARALARHLRNGTLDGRTRIGRELSELRDALAADAGGAENLTAREMLLIERCAAGALICSTLEAHIFGGDGALDAAGEILPILRKGYVTHVQSLSRMLQALGLRPTRAESVPSLETYLQARAGAATPAVATPVIPTTAPRVDATATPTRSDEAPDATTITAASARERDAVEDVVDAGRTDENDGSGDTTHADVAPGHDAGPMSERRAADSAPGADAPKEPDPYLGLQLPAAPPAWPEGRFSHLKRRAGARAP